MAWPGLITAPISVLMDKHFTVMDSLLHQVASKRKCDAYPMLGNLISEIFS